MNRSRQKFIATTIALLALTIPLTGCIATLPNGTGKCDLTVDYPHGSSERNGYIDGKGKVKCVYTSGKLTNLKIETRLQKRNGSVWTTVTNSTKPTTHRTVKSGVTYTGVSGFIVCQKGTFRTQSRSGGYLDGKYSGLSNWITTDTSKGVKNPCVKPLQVVTVR